MFLNLLGAAKGALIRAAASTQTFGCFLLTSGKVKVRILWFTIIFILLALDLGCGCVRDDLTPSRPPSVRGWKSVREGGVNFTAEFLLTVGEKVQNDKVGIELVKINPPEKCYGYLAEWKPAEVVMKFYRIPDGELLMERAFRMGNTLFNNDPISDDPFNIAGISIAYVNTKEGWVFFNLIG